MKHPEYQLQKAVCQYIRVKYPKVLFYSDTIASVKLTKMQSARNSAIQKPNFKMPDIVILEPKEEYHGLMIELKTESPYYKNNPTELKKNEHIEWQQKSMEELITKGYQCHFSWSLDQTIKIIDKYMSQ